jgi:apolipoprotein N-acyltransferase
MKLTRRTSNILLVIGLYMLITWGTRFFTWLGELQSRTLVAPAVHFSLVVIGLAIGIYLTYLGVKGRRATRRTI